MIEENMKKNTKGIKAKTSLKITYDFLKYISFLQRELQDPRIQVVQCVQTIL